MRAIQEGNSCLLSTGAPDSLLHHRTLSGADFFPVLAQPTVDDLEPLAHRTLSGAHRTVRCPIRLLARPRVTRGLCGRPLARPTIGSPDSPVHHQTLSGADFFPILAQPTVEDLEPLAHRTLSGAPIRPLARPRVTRGLRGRPLACPTVGSPDSPVNYSRTLLT